MRRRRSPGTVEPGSGTPSRPMMPLALSNHINSRDRVRMVSGALIGFLLLLSLLLRYVDGALGLALTFSVGLYISAKLRRHMKFFAVMPPEMLPPSPPDPRVFQSDSVKAPSAASQVESLPTTELS